MQSYDGGDFESAGEGQFHVVALVGDVNLDLSVGAADNSSVKPRIGDTVTDDNARYDVNVDGFISTADNSSVKARLGRTAPACP
jgi:hypothetical protein